MKISGYSGFPLSSKTYTFKFQFDLERTGTFKCFVGTKQITIFFFYNNHSKHEKKVEITHKIQKETRDGQTRSRRFKSIAILVFFFFGKVVRLTVFIVLFCCL